MKKSKILIIDEAEAAIEIESNLKRLGYQLTSIVHTNEQAIEKYM